MTTAATLSRRPGSHASAELSPHPAAARQARALTRTTLTQWGIPHLADDAETISAELTANAQHAATAPHGTRPAIIIAIHRRPGHLTIAVWDNGPGHPQPARPAPDAETGRGLAIIDALSQHWGWWPTPVSGGKVVYAVLPAADHTDGPQDGPC